MATPQTAVFALPNVKTTLRVRDSSAIAPEFRTALTKSDLHISTGKHEDAFETLVSAISDRSSLRRRDGSSWKTRKWSDIKDPIQELLRLAFSVRQEEGFFASTKEMYSQLKRLRDQMRGNPNFDDIWGNLVREVRVQMESLLRDAQRCAAVAKAEDSRSLQLVSVVSGVSVDQLSKNRFNVEPYCCCVLRNVVDIYFMGTSVAMQRLVMETVTELAALFKQYHQDQALVILGRQFSNYLQSLLFDPIEEFAKETEHTMRKNERARVLKESRRAFYEEIPIMSAGLSTLAGLQMTTMSRKLWEITWELVGKTLEILKEFLSEDRAVHRPVLVSAYSELAKVFYTCDLRTFHALCLVRAASAQHRISDKAPDAVLATHAVLSALAAPEISERRTLFGASDVEFRQSNVIAARFNLQFAPSRTTLLNEVRVTGILDDAAPAARALLDLLTTAPVDETLCSASQASLDALRSVVVTDHAAGGGVADTAAARAAESDFEQRYACDIRRFALTRYFAHLSERATTINLRSIHGASRRAADQFEDDYRSSIEPVLLEGLQVPVLVDQGSWTATFTTTGLRKLNSAFTTLATLATPPQKTIPTRRPPLPVKLDEIELDINRTILVHELVEQRKRDEVARELKKIAQDKETEKRLQQQRIDAEKERVKKIQDAQTAKLAKEYAAAELRERRRLLVQRIMDKHKGLKLNPDIALLSQQSFMDHITLALAAHLRTMESSKSSDIRQADYFERALRERDIPKRQALEASMQAQLEAEREVRYANYLEQHRREWETKLEVREKLKQFLPHAERFERQLEERTFGKTTKRDEQEELLRAEKARLAAAAGVSVSPPAVSPTTAQPPAAEAGAGSQQDAPKKWVPKSRQQSAQ